MKEKILARTIQYLLNSGVSGLSLRPLAKSIETSDRMILYYFKTKDALIRQAVEELAQLMISKINDRCHAANIKSPGEFIECVWGAFIDPQSRSLSMLFLELDLMSLRDPKSFGDIGKFLMSEWRKVITTNISSFVRDKKKNKIAIEGLSDELLGSIIHHLVSQGQSTKGTLKRLKVRANFLVS